MRALAVALLLIVAADSAAAAQSLCPDAAVEALGPVSSRYLGETEKALEMRFENASAIARPGAFSFDEADALFGRRAEPKADQAVNPEVSYLLVHRGPPQRVGGFRARALAAGYARSDPKRGVVVIERDAGTLAIETRGMRRTAAIRFARRFVATCAARG